MSHLGHLVQPEFEDGENKGKATPDGVRAVDVSFGKRFTGATPNLIRPMLQDLVDYLNGLPGETYTHPVVRATEAHIRLVKIHPYVDGNGRTARILQNFCLEQSDYPPAVIDVSEKGIYFELLSRILNKKAEGAADFQTSIQVDEEIPFQTFIASKVLQSTRRLEEELKKRRIYNVRLDHLRGKGALYSTAEILRHHRTDSNTPTGLTVSVHKEGHGKEGTLEIQGNISKRDLTSELTKILKKYGHTQFLVSPLTECV
jgi:Fic family protein